MRLAYKQLLKEVLHNKLFIILMSLLSFFTSFMYFFVHYSIDGNRRTLNTLPHLTASQLAYENALHSNTTLATNILIAFIALTAFIFAMFFYRFFKKNSKVIGTLKTLGFKDFTLRRFFIYFSAVLSVICGILGLGISYFAADLLIQSSMRSYEVTGLFKAVDISTILVGIFVPALILCLVTWLAYRPIKEKEISCLISPSLNGTSYTNWLRLSNHLANLYPAKDKFPMRLALRKPITLLLILIATTGFSIMFILAYSLNLSSQTIYDSQTKGHDYLFETHFEMPQAFVPSQTSNILQNDSSDEPSNFMPYLDASGSLTFSDTSLKAQMIAFEENSALFKLLDANGQVIPIPKSGQVIINPALHELYNLQTGDCLTVKIGTKTIPLVVSNIAFNAKLNSIYVAPSDLALLLNLPSHTYTGVWSMANNFAAGNVITHAQKIDTLERGFVSNRSSALINQVMGCVMGCILIFLALLLNFQDSIRDILILHLMGYKTPAIRKMLINLYLPILWGFFILTLYPAALTVKAILRSLSLQIGDYMPFQTNGFVILGIFVLLNLIYLLVQFTFNLGIKKVINSDQLYAYTSNE